MTALVLFAAVIFHPRTPRCEDLTRASCRALSKVSHSSVRARREAGRPSVEKSAADARVEAFGVAALSGLTKSRATRQRRRQ